MSAAIQNELERQQNRIEELEGLLAEARHHLIGMTVDKEAVEGSDRFRTFIAKSYNALAPYRRRMARGKE